MTRGRSWPTSSRATTITTITPASPLNTPADVHYGLATAKAAERAVVLAAARSQHPERFATTDDPKILAIPATAWINQPADNTGIELAA